MLLPKTSKLKQLYKYKLLIPRNKMCLRLPNLKIAINKYF